MSDQEPGQDPPTEPTPEAAGDPTRVDTPVSDPTMAMPAPVPPPGGGPPEEPPGPDDPDGPRPDRRPWVIIGLLIVLLLVALALLLANDDDGDEPSATTSSTTTSSTTTSTTTPSTTTTTAPPTTTTTAAPATTIDPARCVSSAADDPDTTANVVYEAYAVGDRGCASNLMTADALDELFAIPGSGGGWEFRGCDHVPNPETDPTSCIWRFEGGSTTFSMQYDAGWVVFDVSQVAD